jgi:pyruvate dehydrogenase E2 component (dihydrolipoamide acetyltransferase)
MAKRVIMPKLGMAMTEGTITDWLKEDGDEVRKGEEIAVIESQKITNEVEAPASGILRIIVKEGEERPIGAHLAFILEPGEEMPDVEGLEPVAVGEAEEQEQEKAQAEAKPAKAEKEPGRPPRSSPLARRLAEEMGVDLAQVEGSGPRGRITRRDVEEFHERQKAREKAAAPEPKARQPEEAVTKPFRGMRKSIAEQMVRSLQTMAQVTLTAKADVTQLVATRRAMIARWDSKVTYTDLLVKAVAKALEDHRLLGARLEGEEIVIPAEVNVGVAVALEEGLIVPVVHDADTLSVLEIHDKLKELSTRARENALGVDEVSGSTFTITNLGTYGIDAFTPVINPPEVAILGVGRITEEVGVENGNFVVRSVLVLSLTIDHRVVDGAPGAAFLKDLITLLEHPALIFA